MGDGIRTNVSSWTDTRRALEQLVARIAELEAAKDALVSDIDNRAGVISASRQGDYVSKEDADDVLTEKGDHLRLEEQNFWNSQVAYYALYGVQLLKEDGYRLLWETGDASRSELVNVWEIVAPPSSGVL